MEASFALLIALLTALLATPWVIRFTVRVGLVDKPNARKVHSKPMPRAGGIAIFLAFAVGFLCTGLLGIPGGFPHMDALSWHFAAGATSMFALGLLDDIFDLSPRWKFLAQFSVAAWMVAAGFQIHPLGISFLDHPLILAIISWVWIVGVTNAVNLIDGMDGLAAGISLLVMASMSVVAVMAHNYTVLILVLPLAGATLGFLRYNFNPAKIFMGDCGSLFLGFSLALISVMNTSIRATATGFMISIVALGVPLFDTLFSMARRMLVGRKPFSPDREHIHHKFLAKGFTHRQVVLILYAITAALGAVSFALVVSDSRVLGALLSAYPLLAYLLIRKLDWIPRIVWIQQRRMRAARVRRYRHDYHDESLATRVVRRVTHSRWFHCLLDVGAIFGAWALAAFITNHLYSPNQSALRDVSQLLVGPVLQTACWLGMSSFFKTHNDLWRYIEFNGIGRHVKPMILSALVAGLVSDLVVGDHWSAQFLLAVVIFSSVAIALVRLLPNFYYSFAKRQAMSMRQGPRVVIFGAGDAGEVCLRVITSYTSLNYQVVGFIDDDPLKKGKAIYGARVLGGINDLEAIRKDLPFDIIIFSTTPHLHSHRWGLSQRLQKMGIKTLKFTPQFAPVLVGNLRDDALGNPPGAPEALREAS